MDIWCEICPPRLPIAVHPQGTIMSLSTEDCHISGLPEGTRTCLKYDSDMQSIFLNAKRNMSVRTSYISPGLVGSVVLRIPPFGEGSRPMPAKTRATSSAATSSATAAPCTTASTCVAGGRPHASRICLCVTPPSPPRRTYLLMRSSQSPLSCCVSKMCCMRKPARMAGPGRRNVFRSAWARWQCVCVCVCARGATSSVQG